MELKGRLGAVASKIPVCGTLVDVGTDHAYIPVFAVEKGICARAVAADVRSGPVEIAERNIIKYGFADRIEARLGSGLRPVAPGEAEVAVLAGMGGPLICEIMQDSIERARSMKLLILQPMNAIEVVRKWLDDEGFQITGEELAGEGHKLYHIICTVWTGRKALQDEYEHFIGNELLHSEDPLLMEYLGRKLRQLKLIIEGREKSEDKRDELEQIKSIRDRLAGDIERITLKGEKR